MDVSLTMYSILNCFISFSSLKQQEEISIKRQEHCSSHLDYTGYCNLVTEITIQENHIYQLKWCSVMVLKALCFCDLEFHTGHPGTALTWKSMLKLWIWRHKAIYWFKYTCRALKTGKDQRYTPCLPHLILLLLTAAVSMLRSVKIWHANIHLQFCKFL